MADNSDPGRWHAPQSDCLVTDAYLRGAFTVGGVRRVADVVLASIIESLKVNATLDAPFGPDGGGPLGWCYCAKHRGDANA